LAQVKSQRLLLIGGGHAHVAVLADWIAHGQPAGAQAVLLTPEPTLRYSGMVPGWIAGQHTSEAGLVDLVALARRAGAELVQDRCAAIDPDARTVTTAGGQTVAFDLASIDTGGEGRARAVLGDDPRLIDVRPIGAFARRLASTARAARVVVAGGGAGGVELAFALRNRAGAPAAVTLVAGERGVLPGFAPSVQRRVAAALARQRIAVIHGRARIEGGAIMAGDATLEPADAIIAALGSAAPVWAQASGLAVDDARVHQRHRAAAIALAPAHLCRRRCRCPYRPPARPVGRARGVRRAGDRRQSARRAGGPSAAHCLSAAPEQPLPDQHRRRIGDCQLWPVGCRRSMGAALEAPHRPALDRQIRCDCKSGVTLCRFRTNTGARSSCEENHHPRRLCRAGGRLFRL
jgi:uncharacterized protein YjeT (DUF2065 family)